MRAGASAVTIALLVGLAGCAGAGRSRLVRVLFDEPPSATPADSAAAAIGPALAAPAPSPAAPAARFRHAPFESGDCGECHALGASASFGGRASRSTAPAADDRSGARLRFPKDRICFECHDDMTAEALAGRSKVLHAPAEGGECLECHDPHESRWPALLVDGDPLEKLCFRCHDVEGVVGEEPHAALAGEARTCTRCHDPHGADRAGLLKS